MEPPTIDPNTLIVEPLFINDYYEGMRQAEYLPDGGGVYRFPLKDAAVFETTADEFVRTMDAMVKMDREDGSDDGRISPVIAAKVIGSSMAIRFQTVCFSDSFRKHYDYILDRIWKRELFGALEMVFAPVEPTPLTVSLHAYLSGHTRTVIEGMERQGSIQSLPVRLWCRADMENAHAA